MKNFILALPCAAALVGCDVQQQSTLHEPDGKESQIFRFYRANDDANKLRDALGGEKGIASEDGHMGVGCHLLLPFWPAYPDAEPNVKKLTCSVELSNPREFGDHPRVTLQWDSDGTAVSGRGTADNSSSAKLIYDTFSGLKPDSAGTKNISVTGATIIMKKQGDDYSVEMTIIK